MVKNAGSPQGNSWRGLSDGKEKTALAVLLIVLILRVGFSVLVYARPALALANDTDRYVPIVKRDFVSYSLRLEHRSSWRIAQHRWISTFSCRRIFDPGQADRGCSLGAAYPFRTTGVSHLPVSKARGRYRRGIYLGAVICRRTVNDSLVPDRPDRNSFRSFVGCGYSGAR